MRPPIYILLVITSLTLLTQGKELVDTDGRRVRGSSLTTTNDIATAETPNLSQRTGAGSGDQSETRRTTELDSLFMKTVIPFYFQQVFDELRELESASPGTILQRLFTGVSPNCTAHSLEWIYQVYNRTDLTEAATWATQMMDAWAKPPEGILSGHTNALGDYDECVGIRTTNVTFSFPNPPLPEPESKIGRSFRGKYCVSFVYPKNYPDFDLDNEKIVDLLMRLQKKTAAAGERESRLVSEPSIARESVRIEELMELMFDLNGPWLLPSFGSCFPSSCSIMDTHYFIENVLNILKLRDQLDFLTFDCFTDEKSALGFWDFVMLSFLALLLVVCLMATMIEMNQVRNLNAKTSKFKEAFLAFSLNNSIKKWLNTEKSIYELKYGTTCLNGLQFLTVAWIVLGNTWEMPLFGYHPAWNNIDMKKMYKHWSTLLVTNDVAIDTFFTISGFCIAIRIFELLDKHRGSMNVFVFYIRSLIRFTPTYALVIGLIATLYSYLGSGPYSGYLGHSSQNCKSNWWSNLFYVNNFVNATFENICITDSWYFANEMQFILLSPFVLIPLWTWGKVGFGFVFLLIVGSILSPGLITWQYEYLPSGIPLREFQMYFQEVFIKPWIHATPFLVGILCALLVLTTRKASSWAKIPALLATAGWLLSTAAALSITFGLFPYFDPSKSIPLAEASIYAALHRFGWAVVISWVIFACARGSGGLVNRFLSWTLFKPLARLTMSTYLVAMPVQMILHLSFRQSITHDTYTMVNFYLADLVMSIAVAFIITVTMQIPCHQIAKLVFHEENKVLVLPPGRERFGVFYNNDISISVGAASEGKAGAFDMSIEMSQPRRRRYGIYYENSVSENSKEDCSRSH